MRGDLVSRPVGEVLREAEQLVRAGVKEILVISQDTSAYGVDLKYAAQPWRNVERRARFFDLSAALGELGVWIRLHYVYPYPHVDQVVELMAEGKILPYLDIPFQHASARILKLMKRPAAATDTLQRIAAWRRLVPDMTIRSTFIVGFPGETSAGLRRAARLAAGGAARSRRLFRILAGSRRGGQCAQRAYGCLRNSRPSAAPASWNSPAEISAARLKQKVGRKMQVLIDSIGNGHGESGGIAIARSSSDAPEIDGTVRIAVR